MGAETAPVAGSTRWPACTARVSIFMCRGEVTNSERIVDLAWRDRSRLKNLLPLPFKRGEEAKLNCIDSTFQFDDAIRPVEIATCIASFDALNSERVFMTIYDDEVFKMACDQFRVIAD